MLLDLLEQKEPFLEEFPYAILNNSKLKEAVYKTKHKQNTICEQYYITFFVKSSWLKKITNDVQ
jgi:hypothetical protein